MDSLGVLQAKKMFTVWKINENIMIVTGSSSSCQMESMEKKMSRRKRDRALCF